MARRDSNARIEELAREFDRTRQRLDGTLVELADRTRPATIVRRRVQRLRDAGQELLSEVRAAADGEAGEAGYDDTRPIPPEVVAVGVGIGALAAIGLVVWLRRRRR